MMGPPRREVCEAAEYTQLYRAIARRHERTMRRLGLARVDDDADDMAQRMYLAVVGVLAQCRPEGNRREALVRLLARRKGAAPQRSHGQRSRCVSEGEREIGRIIKRCKGIILSDVRKRARRRGLLKRLFPSIRPNGRSHAAWLRRVPDDIPRAIEPEFQTDADALADFEARDILDGFARWCRSIIEPKKAEVTREAVERYLDELESGGRSSRPKTISAKVERLKKAAA